MLFQVSCYTWFFFDQNKLGNEWKEAKVQKEQQKNIRLDSIRQNTCIFGNIRYSSKGVQLTAVLVKISNEKENLIR